MIQRIAVGISIKSLHLYYTNLSSGRAIVTPITLSTVRPTLDQSRRMDQESSIWTAFIRTFYSVFGVVTLICEKR